MRVAVWRYWSNVLLRWSFGTEELAGRTDASPREPWAAYPFEEADLLEEIAAAAHVVRKGVGDAHERLVAQTRLRGASAALTDLRSKA